MCCVVSDAHACAFLVFVWLITVVWAVGVVSGVLFRVCGGLCVWLFGVGVCFVWRVFGFVWLFGLLFLVLLACVLVRVCVCWRVWLFGVAGRVVRGGVWWCGCFV